ncbi:MAG TPA: zinc finger domain-containing protein [Acidimicrobiia bacterium]|nr:zinc finger domain-containing protein [Acidimicrobiia bacterium]
MPEPEGRYVYKQERCRRCGTPVESWLLAGRTAYACPRDQPPPYPGG